MDEAHALRSWLRWAGLDGFDRELRRLGDAGLLTAVEDLYRLDVDAVVRVGIAESRAIELVRALAEHPPVAFESVLLMLGLSPSELRGVERGAYGSMREIMEDPAIERRAPELEDSTSLRAAISTILTRAPWLATARLAPLVLVPQAVSRARSAAMEAAAGCPLHASRAQRFGARADALRARLGFELPDDFFAVYELASSIAPDAPLAAFERTLSLTLIGPFTVLADEAAPRDDRFFRGNHPCESPELFTVLGRKYENWQTGYWVDDPAARPSWVVSFYGDEGYAPRVVGRTLFDVLRSSLENRVSNLDDDEDHEGPALDALRERLVEYGTSDRTERGTDYLLAHYDDDAMLERRRITAAPTAEGVGIVVPHASYARPSRSARELRAMLESEAGADAVARDAQKALADGHPGTALELAKALWSWSPMTRSASFSLLQAAYRALGRPHLAEVVEEHRSQWR